MFSETSVTTLPHRPTFVLGTVWPAMCKVPSRRVELFLLLMYAFYTSAITVGSILLNMNCSLSYK